MQNSVLVTSCDCQAIVVLFIDQHQQHFGSTIHEMALLHVMRTQRTKSSEWHPKRNWQQGVLTLAFSLGVMHHRHYAVCVIIAAIRGDCCWLTVCVVYLCVGIAFGSFGLLRTVRTIVVVFIDFRLRVLGNEKGETSLATSNSILRGLYNVYSWSTVSQS